VDLADAIRSDIDSFEHIVFDLDNTLYPVDMVPKDIVSPLLSCLHKLNDFKPRFEAIEIKEIIDDLWNIDFGTVVQKHAIPDNFVQRILEIFDEMRVETHLSLYEGALETLDLGTSNILVTTGFYNLQMSKIERLGIGHYFQGIYVSDPLLRGTRKESSKSYWQKRS